MMRPFRLFFIVLAVLICTVQASAANAGITDIYRHILSSWSSYTLGSQSTQDANDNAPVEGESAPEGDASSKTDEGDGAASTGPKGMCKVPQEPALMRCEIGSGFLCVDTPEGGVASEVVSIRGTIDRQGSVLASFRIAVQNEYTKQVQYVDTSAPTSSNCWSGNVSGFCLDAQGKFSAAVPLQGTGPYTVSVSASRLSGESVEKKVRTSRVTAPKLLPESISFTPDILKSEQVNDAYVTATIDLLGTCSFCDFIGAGTGGVTVTVDTTVTDAAGYKRNISCATTVEQGGQGRYVIGVPVMPGKNDLVISACNSANAGKCTKLSNFSFNSQNSENKLEILEPKPQPSYSADEFPVINWKFKMGGDAKCVQVRFNREAVREVCADASQIFSTELLPRAGINVATVGTTESPDEFAWTFGWGEITSPFESESGSISVSNALDISLSEHAINNIIVPALNNFLTSDEFSKVAKDISSGLGTPKTGVEGDAAQVTKPDIPHCESGSGMSGFITKIRDFSIGSAKISAAKLSEGKLSLAIDTTDLKIAIDLAADKAGDGVGDFAPLPLIVSFKIAKFEVELSSGKDSSGEYFIVGSPYTDCNYKDKSYCTKMPASLVIKNFQGNATKWGTFVVCNDGEADDSVKPACKSLNSLNAQTGVIAEKVLDALNSTIYCGGSQAITALIRSPKNFKLPIGCASGAECAGVMGFFDRVEFPLGVKLDGAPKISERGFSAAVELSVGDEEYFNSIPDGSKIPSSGIISDVATKTQEVSFANDFGASLALKAMNAIFFGATAHGDGVSSRGLLDFDISEKFFERLSFDFVKECDAFEPVAGVKDKIPALCYVRPRVMELLGSALSGYGYFQPKQPLLMAIRGNRALSPRLSISNSYDMPVVPTGAEADSGGTGDSPLGTILEFSLGGANLSFYALEIDAAQQSDMYGNLPVKIGADGKPVIKIIRKEISDPWRQQIVSFDMTLLLAMEISGPSVADDGSDQMSMRILADRTRLVLSPVEGSNFTTIASKKLISTLAEQVMTALTQFSSKEGAIKFKIPSGISFDKFGDDTFFKKFGLETITWGDGGFSLKFDDENDVIRAGISAIVSQALTYGGATQTFELK